MYMLKQSILILALLMFPKITIAQTMWLEPETVTYLGLEKITPQNNDTYWIKNKENSKLSCGQDMAMFLSRNAASGESIIVHGYVRDQNYGVAVQDVVFAINDNNYKNYPKENSYSKEISGVLKYHPGTPNSGDIPVVYIANGNKNTHLCICKQALYDNSLCQSHFKIEQLLNTQVVIKGEMIKVEDGEDPDKPFDCFNPSSITSSAQQPSSPNPLQAHNGSSGDKKQVANTSSIDAALDSEAAGIANNIVEICSNSLHFKTGMAETFGIAKEIQTKSQAKQYNVELDNKLINYIARSKAVLTCAYDYYKCNRTKDAKDTAELISFCNNTMNNIWEARRKVMIKYPERLKAMELIDRLADVAQQKYSNNKMSLGNLCKK